MIEEIVEDLEEVDLIEEQRLCIQQYVINVVKIAKFLLSLLETNQYTVVTVLKKREVVDLTDQIGLREEMIVEEALEEEEIEVINQCSLRYAMIVV